VRSSALHRTSADAVVRKAEALTAESEDNTHVLHAQADPYRLSTWEKSIAHDSIMASAVWREGAFMPGRIYRVLADDHARLDGLLQRAMTEAGAIDRAAYSEFRAGRLKHNGMEEKILLPAAQRVRGGGPLALAAKVRLDHGALAALLVPTLTPAIVAALRIILGAHNPLEEGPGGLYECCERLAGAEAETLLAQLRAAPEVPVAPHADGPQVMAVVCRALVRAGYDAALLTETP
jgi:hypothetical protein